MSLLLDTFIPTIFSHSVVCIFILLMESFDEQKFSILMKSNWSIIFFMVSCVYVLCGVCVRACARACVNPASEIFAKEKLFPYSWHF